MKRTSSKTLRRTLAMLLSICMVGLLLAGCGSKSADEGTADKAASTTSESSNAGSTAQVESTAQAKVEVDSVGDPKVDLGGRKFRVMGTAPDPETDAGQKRLARLEEIKKWYNCDIEFVEGTNEVYDTFYASILAGDPILDIGGVGQIGWFFQNVGSNMYYPISDLKAINLEDSRWNKGIMDMYTFNGKKYALSTNGLLWGQGLFVNIDLLKRSGVTEDVYDLQKNDQWTWDKFLEMAKKATKVGSDGTTETWGVADQGSLLLRNMIVSFGGHVVNNNNGKYSFGFDSPQALAALTFYQDLAVKEKVFLPQGSQDRAYADNLFKAGKLAFNPGYPWFGANYKDMADNYAFVRFPMKDATIGTVAVFDWPGADIIPATVKDPEAVGVFANAYYAPDPTATLDQQIEQSKEAWSVWFRDSRALDETAMSFWKDNKINSEQHYMFLDGNDEWSIMNPFFDQIAQGLKTPASAAQELVPQLNAIIEKRITGQK